MLFVVLVFKIAAARTTRTIAGDLDRAETARRSVTVVFARIHVASDALIFFHSKNPPCRKTAPSGKGFSARFYYVRCKEDYTSGSLFIPVVEIEDPEAMGAAVVLP